MKKQLLNSMIVSWVILTFASENSSWVYKKLVIITHTFFQNCTNVACGVCSVRRVSQGVCVARASSSVSLARLWPWIYKAAAARESAPGVIYPYSHPPLPILSSSFSPLPARHSLSPFIPTLTPTRPYSLTQLCTSDVEQKSRTLVIAYSIWLKLLISGYALKSSRYEYALKSKRSEIQKSKMEMKIKCNSINVIQSHPNSIKSFCYVC